jgi:hypothetical protein
VIAKAAFNGFPRGPILLTAPASYLTSPDARCRSREWQAVAKFARASLARAVHVMRAGLPNPRLQGVAAACAALAREHGYDAAKLLRAVGVSFAELEAAGGDL